MERLQMPTVWFGGDQLYFYFLIICLLGQQGWFLFVCNGFDGWEPRNDQKTEEGCILGTTTYCLHHHYQHNYEYIMIVMVFVLENDHYCDAQGGEWKPPTNCGVEERGGGSSS